MKIHWEGNGVDEIGILDSVNSEASAHAPLTPGKIIVKVDPRYFRPTEVEILMGDPSKAKTKIGWSPKITFAEMVCEDLKLIERDRLCKGSGFEVFSPHG